MKPILLITSTLLIFNLSYSNVKVGSNEFEIYDNSSILFEDTIREAELIGTWYFLSKDNDRKSKLDNLVEGKSLVIKIDHKYESDIFETKENGDWSFDEKTQILKCTAKGNQTSWELKLMNYFGIVLLNLETNESWTFSAAAE